MDELGAPARKKLHVIVLADCSYSMDGDKIQSLNRTMEEIVPELQEANEENPFAEMVMRVIAFSSGARWHVGASVAVDQFVWSPLVVDGLTELGAGIDLMAEALSPESMGRRNLPPVILLLTDGAPTDDWRGPLKRFNDTPWGKRGRTVRVGIAVGEDADKAVLEEFTGNVESVFAVHQAAQLRAMVRWATVTLSQAVSRSVVGGDGVKPDDLPAPPPIDLDADDDDDVW